MIIRLCEGKTSRFITWDAGRRGHVEEEEKTRGICRTGIVNVRNLVRNEHTCYMVIYHGVFYEIVCHMSLARIYLVYRQKIGCGVWRKRKESLSSSHVTQICTRHIQKVRSDCRADIVERRGIPSRSGVRHADRSNMKVHTRINDMKLRRLSFYGTVEKLVLPGIRAGITGRDDRSFLYCVDRYNSSLVVHMIIFWIGLSDDSWERI